ncbi:MAG: glycosyltransferase, partial [Acidimicrobiales bacterium]
TEPRPARAPSFSVVVNTDNRAQSLALTLRGLAHLDHRCFEVIVVCGPTKDATPEVLAPYRGAIKIGHCTERNLAASRNIGVAMAAGEVVAFIDDDAYPDPAWLDRLGAGYDDEEVAGVGGPTWHWSGATLGVSHSWSNRLGDVWVDLARGFDPSFVVNRPGTASFSYPIGTNMSFLRERLVGAGGFDEEFDYGFEEVDLCHRLTDAGWLVRVVDDALVYHKSLPSPIRGENRATHNMGVLLKNKAYYTFKHGWGTAPLSEMTQSLAAYARHYRDEITSNIDAGLLSPEDLERYEADVVASFDEGHRRWATGLNRRRDPGWFQDRRDPLVPFETLRPPASKLNLCFVSREYPPAAVNGIGRVVSELARALGARGHEVHVLTEGSAYNTVDLEDDVWVHRVATKPHPAPDAILVPKALWDYSASVAQEVSRIHQMRPVDLLQAPNWDSEGVALLCDGRFPVVLGLYTPLATVTTFDGPLSKAAQDHDQEILALLELERLSYLKAPYFLACGPSIVAEIESSYGVTLPQERVGLVPHGLADRSAEVVPIHWDNKIEVLFVGRLEDRKGIDTLLQAIPMVLSANPGVGFTIVGEDTRPMSDGLTHRQAFERSAAWEGVKGSVRFLGRVQDDELYGHYAGCDMFVAPSRYESFGLILIEAMMFAKPVIASAVGGMAEIVRDQQSGLLVAAGDPWALASAISTLAQSEPLRRRLGSFGKERFERHYSEEQMVEGVNRFYDSILGRATATERAAGTYPKNDTDKDTLPD